MCKVFLIVLQCWTPLWRSRFFIPRHGEDCVEFVYHITIWIFGCLLEGAAVGNWAQFWEWDDCCKWGMTYGIRKMMGRFGKMRFDNGWRLLTWVWGRHVMLERVQELDQGFQQLCYIRIQEIKRCLLRCGNFSNRAWARESQNGAGHHNVQLRWFWEKGVEIIST